VPQGIGQRVALPTSTVRRLGEPRADARMLRAYSRDQCASGGPASQRSNSRGTAARSTASLIRRASLFVAAPEAPVPMVNPGTSRMFRMRSKLLLTDDRRGECHHHACIRRDRRRAGCAAARARALHAPLQRSPGWSSTAREHGTPSAANHPIDGRTPTWGRSNPSADAIARWVNNSRRRWCLRSWQARSDRCVVAKRGRV
jgi:hypothetical protein